MVFYLTAVSAVMPSLLLMWFFYKRDLHPEPAKVLWATFGLGVVIVVPVLLVAVPLDWVIGAIPEPFLKAGLQAFFTAAIPEEFFKLAVLTVFCVRRAEFDEPMDGIVYGVAASLGFATMENCLYVAEGGIGLAVLRGLTAVPGHAFLGAILGYFVGRARFDETRRSEWYVKGFALVVLLHGLYDFPLMSLELGAANDSSGEPGILALPLSLLFLAVLAFETVYAIRLARRVRRGQEASDPTPASTARVAAKGLSKNSGRSEPESIRDAGKATTGFRAEGVAGTYVEARVPVGNEPGARSGPAQQTRGYWTGPKRPSMAAGVVLTVIGVPLASVGGLVTLAVLLAAIGGDDAQQDVVEMLIGGAIIGLLPLALGLLSFGFGVRRLVRA